MLIRRPANRAGEPIVCIQPRISRPEFRAFVYKPRGAVAQLSGSTFIYVSGVSICDVGPRDGLQNEARTLEPSVRASLCDRLANAGLKKMEAASFVNPKLVPQMGGAEEVMSALHRKPGVVYAGLVLNEKGYDRARAAGVDEIHYAFSATDEFGRRNQNATAAEIGRARSYWCGALARTKCRSRSPSVSRSAARSKARCPRSACSGWWSS